MCSKKNNHMMIGDAIVGNLVLSDNLILQNVVTSNDNAILKTFTINSNGVTSINNVVKIKSNINESGSTVGIIIDNNGLRFGKVSVDENSGEEIIKSEDAKILADLEGNLTFDSGTVNNYTSIGGWSIINGEGLQYPATNPTFFMRTKPNANNLLFNLTIGTVPLMKIDKNGKLSGKFSVPDGSINNSEIANGSVDGSKFADKSISAGNIQSTTTYINGAGPNTISGLTLSKGSIGNATIKNYSITFDKLTVDAITSHVTLVASLTLTNFDATSAISSSRIAGNIIDDNDMIEDGAININRVSTAADWGTVDKPYIYYIRKNLAEDYQLKFVHGVLTSIALVAAK